MRVCSVPDCIALRKASASRSALQLHDDLVVFDFDGLDSMNEPACFRQPCFDCFVHSLGQRLLVSLSGEKPGKPFSVAFHIKILNLEFSVLDHQSCRNPAIEVATANGG